MKLTKRILSLCLALAMLLTVATFPAFAEEYTPKTVEFVKTASYSKIDQHRSNMSFALPQVDIYVGDTIKFSDTFFADNEFTYGDTAVTGVSVAVRNCAAKTKVEIYSWGKDSDPAYKASCTFTEPGFYMLTSSNVYYDDGSNPNKWLAYTGDYRWGVIEVKAQSEYGKVVDTPVTNKTEGDAVVLASATLDYLPNGGKDATVQSASILGSSTIDIGTNLPAGTVLGFAFNFETLGYIENITFTATNDNMFSAADIYGSVDGENWYLIADDQEISPNGASSAWSSTTFTATVNAVAKYVKIKNFTYKGATYLNGISGAAATGVAITEADLVQPEEPTTVDVTFVDVDGANDDVVKTIDAGATVTIPDAYATGYKFYADEDCTEEITDLETRTFDANTTIYVKAIPVTPDPDPEQPTGPKTVELKASIFAKKQTGPNIFARPADYNLKAGDSLAIADGAVLNSAWYTAMGLSAEQVKGIEIKYGTSFGGMSSVYLKLESDGTMAGFYTSVDFTTPATITLGTAGIYVFTSQNYVNASGELVAFLATYPNDIDNPNNGCLWAIEVKPADTPEVTNPDKGNYTIGTVGTLTLTEGITEQNAATATGNIAYIEDLSIQGVITPDKKIDGESTTPFTFIKASNTVGNMSPWGGFRIDLETVTYLEKLSIKTGLWGASMYWDLYGSLDGTSWYYINSASAATVNGILENISVDAVVKHLRLVVTDATNLYGQTAFDVTAITGATATSNSSEEPADPQVKDENGNVLFEEITDDVLATLPSYFKVSGKNYVVKSWTMDGEAIDYAALKALTAADVAGDIVPELVEVPFDVAKLSKDVTKSDKDDTAFEEGAKYVNGLHIQGAQIRFPETNVTAGLRFVNVVDRELEATLESLVEAGTISNLSRGTLAIGGVNYDNVDLTVANTGVDNDGKKIYKTADLFDGEYYKYTLCVTGFQPEQYKLAVYVRPYITFTYGTETVYLYGEQFKTDYKAVVEEAVRVGGLTPEQLSYCNDILG